jgi:hypothetical protein
MFGETAQLKRKAEVSEFFSDFVMLAVLTETMQFSTVQGSLSQEVGAVL